MKLPGFGAWILLPLLAVGAARGAEIAPIYAGLSGKVMLDNPRVQVEKFVLAPGASTGRHSYPADQLVVFVKAAHSSRSTAAARYCGKTVACDGTVPASHLTAAAPMSARNRSS